MSPKGPDPEGTEIVWTVPASARGERLDRHAAAHLDQPRSRLQRWIAAGHVAVDGVTAERPSLTLRGGERLFCRRPAPRDERLLPEAGELEILFEDEHLLVLDKVAGQVVHPGAGHHHGTLCNVLLHHYPEIAGVGGPGRPGIVHRLDRETSGVMVIARSDRAYRHLQRAFAERRVDKTYLAVVYGRLADRGVFDQPIGRHRTRRKEMSVHPGGRPARTLFRRLDFEAPTSVAAIDLETGRTHQIRVHFKHGRHPLVGDPTYGENRWREASGRRQKVLREFPRPALHAYRLAFAHPVSDETLAFTAPPPTDLEGLWQALAGRPLPRPTAGGPSEP